MTEVNTSWATGEKPRKRLPSDDLPERRNLMRRLTPEPPTIKELERHAQKFGSEFVLETAVELGYNFDSCVRLADACDRADLELLRKVRPNAKLDKRPLSEVRVATLMGIEREELVA